MLIITSMLGTPTRIACPPRRVMVMAWSMVGPRPMTSKATSAPRSSVIDITWDTGSPWLALIVAVAPNSLAICSLVSFISTAMISPAPLMRAPWMTLRPTPPQPMTATVSPFLMSAVFIAAPTPVSTPHPMRAATLMSTSSGIFTAPISGMTVCSENVPDAAICPTLASFSLKRGVPSRRPPVASAWSAALQRWPWSRSQW